MKALFFTLTISGSQNDPKPHLKILNFPQITLLISINIIQVKIDIMHAER